MFDEEKCPYCGKSHYSLQYYKENYPDDNHFTREWFCKCEECHIDFSMTYLYELKKVKVSAS